MVENVSEASSLTSGTHVSLSLVALKSPLGCRTPFNSFTFPSESFLISSLDTDSLTPPVKKMRAQLRSSN